MKSAASAGIECVGLTHQHVEVTEYASVAEAMTRIRPRIVVNSTSLTNVEQCEVDPQAAYSVNTVGALIVARAAAEIGARVVYISTDYVFGGDKPPAFDGIATAATAYLEDDPLCPLNVYGASKAAGERATALTASDHLIVRVSSLFGKSGSRGKRGNFVETVLEKARKGGPLRVVSDQWMTPTYTGHAAGVIIALANDMATGVVHVTNSGVCTWYAFARAIVEEAGLHVPIEAIPASTYTSTVRRPRNSALMTSRLATLRDSPLPSWEEAVSAYLRPPREPAEHP